MLFCTLKRRRLPRRRRRRARCSWSQISNRASLCTDPVWLCEEGEVLRRSKASKMERDVTSYFLVSPLCLVLKATEPPRRTRTQERVCFIPFRLEPAEVSADEASGRLCLDLAHLRCKVCNPSALRVLICLRKAPGHLQICKNVTWAGRLRVLPSSILHGVSS